MRRAVARCARAWIGTPYRHMAATRGAGCDCLGLIRGVWGEVHGVPVPEVAPYSADWRCGGRALQDGFEAALSRGEGPPEPGQVLLFRLRRGCPPRHCAIMSGPGRFVHAQEQIGVIETALDHNWTRRLAGVFDF